MIGGSDVCSLPETWLRMLGKKPEHGHPKHQAQRVLDYDEDRLPDIPMPL